MKIFTWNTQGDFTDPLKKNVISALFKEGCDIGMIQEGGDAATSQAIPGCLAISGVGVGAKLERCTNYVILSDKLVKDAKPKLVGFSAMGGGEAGRTAAAVVANDVCYVSWHSLSGDDNSDTSALIDECGKLKDVAAVVIGGDFNATPEVIDDLIQRKLDKKRHPLAVYTKICNSGAATQKKGKELDFFVLMGSDLGNLVAKAKAYSMAQYSDHDVVIMEIG